MTVSPPRFETCGLRSRDPSERRWRKILVRAATFEGMRASQWKRMKVALRAVALMLVLQMFAGTLMLHAELLPSPAAQAPAGCHQHSPKVPSPQPKNYVCCLSGHDSAILQASTIVGPSSDGQVVGAGFEPPIASARIAVGGPLLSISPGDPPVNLALRI